MSRVTSKSVVVVAKPAGGERPVQRKKLGRKDDSVAAMSRVTSPSTVVVSKSPGGEAKGGQAAQGKKRALNGGVGLGPNDVESEASEPRKKKAKKRKAGVKVKIAPIAEEVVPFTSLDATLQEQNSTIPW
mmetsp:Transcript_120759/g.276812  ORF Transcript_120759/g.276812 Transcript_120759/m.276812 type:complete len:130 (+) Transcript_120759:2155-2544(+)